MISPTQTHRQIVFDTETTGMNQESGPVYLGHKVIEIGCVELINRKLTGNNFHVYIKPDRLVDPDAIKVHGITDDFLKDKPAFSQVAQQFYEYVQGAELIAHNANFDISFIDHEFALLNRFGKITDHCQVTDTLQLAREKKNRGELQGNLNLDALCRFYGIDNTHRTLHGALLDAEILADVYLYMTGGQRKLEFSSEFGGEGIIRLTTDRPLTKVIQASVDELSEHAKRMALIPSSKWRN